MPRRLRPLLLASTYPMGDRMNDKMREQFEQSYSEDNGGVPASFIKLQRLGDSYGIPKVARAWYWFKRSRESLVIELPDLAEMAERAAAGNEYSAIRIEQQARCRKAIEAVGLKVTQ